MKKPPRRGDAVATDGTRRGTTRAGRPSVKCRSWKGRSWYALTQTLDLVLELQLLALQRDNAEIVGTGMNAFFLDFLLESLMTTLEFGQMGLQCHAVSPMVSDVTSLTQSAVIRNRNLRQFGASSRYGGQAVDSAGDLVAALARTGHSDNSGTGAAPRFRRW